MKYRTIVADPPWPYERFGGFNGQPGRPRREVIRELPYESMNLADIAAIPIVDLADPAGANIFMWTTNRYLPDAFNVMRAWGAIYRQMLVWFKTGTNPLTGSIAPTACEYLLFGRIGAGAPLAARMTTPLITTKRPGPNQHSRKPDVWIDEIERVSPGPYAELFARRARFGWDYWGDQSLETVQL